MTQINLSMEQKQTHRYGTDKWLLRGGRKDGLGVRD